MLFEGLPRTLYDRVTRVYTSLLQAGAPKAEFTCVKLVGSIMSVRISPRLGTVGDLRFMAEHHCSMCSKNGPKRVRYFATKGRSRRPRISMDMLEVLNPSL